MAFDPAHRSSRTAAWRIPRDCGQLRFQMTLDPADPTEKMMLDYHDGGGFYEPEISHLMLNVLKHGDVVVDVGANCGYFALLAGTLVGESGRVVAIEPAAECLARLRANVALNGLTNVEVLDRVASNHAGETRFYLNSDNSGGHALWNPGEWPSNQKSREHPISTAKLATALDAEWKKRGLPLPKLIKTDTEGAEQFVLEGARELLSGCKVPFVVAELHEFGLGKLGCTQASLRGLMESLGYATFGLYFSGAMPKFVPSGVQIRSQFLINILFSTPRAIAEYWPVAALDPRSPL
jgi:FkbM family methyltransferase